MASDPKGLAAAYLQRYGYVLINGLRPDKLLLDLHGLRLGYAMAQPEGPAEYDIKQTAGRLHVSDGQGGAFQPAHTDGSPLPAPPMLALFCREPGPTPEATYIFNLVDFLLEHPNVRHFAFNHVWEWTNSYTARTV